MKKLKFILIVALIGIGQAFKWVWKKIKGFVKWEFSKTTVDEEVSDRVKVMKEEVKDVKKALGEAVDQSQDIVKAAKGKKRRGRPKKS